MLLGEYLFEKTFGYYGAWEGEGGKGFEEPLLLCPILKEHTEKNKP